MIEEFRQLGLSEQSISALQAKGFEEPTEIQRQCIPILLKEHSDVIGQAMTGTGKTAAFGLPILEMIDPSVREVQALVLTPTRELCMQVSDEIISLAGKRRISIAPIYGGASMELQLRQLRRGVDVVVGTPGRVLDHIERGTLNISNIKCFVLDEADEMLDMGFIEDIETILENAPEDKRMLCFSATMPEPILKLATRFMPNYKLVRTQKEDLTSSLTDQIYYETQEKDKLEILLRIIEVTEDFYGIVFCRTKVQCDEIGRKLIDRGYNAEALHGDLSQKQRELIIHKMKEHLVSILVATDVAARGIDLQELTHVINYSLPQDPETYIHRVGRTGRAGKNGTAITFVNSSEFRKFSFMKRIANCEIRSERVPSLEEIQKIKALKIKEKLNTALSLEPDEKFINLAKAILNVTDPTVALSAVLKLSFEKEMDISRFAPIEEPRPKKSSRKGKSNAEGKDNDQRRTAYAGVDDQGNVRLFIAKGERDGVSKKSLINLLITRAGANNSDLNELEVHDDFSFVTAPAEVAEKIIRAFRSQLNRDGKPIVTKAKKLQGESKKSKSKSRRVERSKNDRYERYERTSDRDSYELLSYGKSHSYSSKPKKGKKRK